MIPRPEPKCPAEDANRGFKNTQEGHVKEVLGLHSGDMEEWFSGLIHVTTGRPYHGKCVDRL
tara:strand:+ start:681 stop:866 length:186 start_codon:yes stop_codon:yes gene_type:complete